MKLDPEKTFAAHNLGSIIQARDNLAEVTLFRARAGRHRQDRESMWHLIGNLTIAAEASAADDAPPVQHVAEAIEGVGGDFINSYLVLKPLLTRQALKKIFALQHIPSGAPELTEDAQYHELHVARFILEARALNPDTPAPPQYFVNGNHLFFGWYHQTLS